MRILWFLLLAVATAKCPPKELALDCFYETADTNHDVKISRHELSHAIYSRLPWYKKAGFALFGGIDQVLKDCDYNHDGVLTKEEAYLMPKTCMNSCYKRSMTVELFHCSSA